MSNEALQSEEENQTPLTLDKQLEAVYTRLQHSHLSSKLEEIAETLEQTLIRATIATNLFNNFDVKLEDETKQEVSEAIELLEDEKYDELEAEISDLRSKVNDQHSRVNRQISIPHAEYNKQLDAMQDLNEEFGVVDQARLNALETLLNDEQWVESAEGDSTEAKLDWAEEYGQDTVQTLEELQSEMFAQLLDEESIDLASKLISDDSFHLTELDDDGFSSLQNSKLNDYIELSLSPLQTEN